MTTETATDGARPGAAAGKATAAEPLAPGALLAGRYRIVEWLGRGGMGEVYRADDLKLDQRVALKLLPAELERRPEVFERFLVEVRLARQISHPNVCRVYDVHESAGRHLLVMELISGGNLAELLARVGRLPADRVIEIGREAALGLDAIHQQGIVHRDLKPSNLMLDAEGRIRITDFGIAKLASDTERPATILGTPAYMAPERISGEEATASGDLYSLGLVLLELATGQREPEMLEKGEPEIDPHLARIVRRCLANDPAARPASAGLIATTLGEGSEMAGTQVRALLAHRPRIFQPQEIGGSPAELLARYGGRLAALAGRDEMMLFERPWNAVRYALEVEGGGRTRPSEGRAAIHVGEVELSFHYGELVASGDAVSAVCSLVELAAPGQVLLSRGAFDLARQGAEGASGRIAGGGRLRWLAHGEYALTGLRGGTLEVFEIGREGSAPLAAPPSSDSGQPLPMVDAILGWRAAPGLEIPERPNWLLERKIGEGGFGEVWLAGQPTTGARRVFKFCYDATRLRSLQREITLFRLLKEELGERPDIHRILDWRFDAAPFFLEVEHSAGGNLAEWAEQEGGLTSIALEERLEIVAQIATALDAAHSVGVLHKDVKPANVLMRRAGNQVRAQLADFGVGEIVERERLREAGITVAGLTLLTRDHSRLAGTRLYMAPELLEGRVATVQADVYALGVLLFQMAAGDFSRALAPGWEREIDDELLRADIAAAVDGSPERRLSNAGFLAGRIRSLGARRQEKDGAQRRRLEARRAADRARRYRFWTAALLVILVAGVFVLRARQHELERTASFLKVAVANDWLERDPTLAGRVLLEVENEAARPFALDLARRVLNEPLAVAELRHQGPVSTARFSPDGTSVLTASADGRARLWDARTGELRLELGHQGAVASARFDRRGERILTASADGAARVWGLPEARPKRILRHSTALSDARFSPAGEHILTAGVDGEARVYDLDENGSAAVLRHDAEVVSARFHPTANLVLTASRDGTARVWHFAGERFADGAVTRLLRHDGPVLQAVFDPAGRRVLTTSRDGTARLWDYAADRAVVLLRSDVVILLAAAFDPHGHHAAAASFEKIWIWNVADPQSIGEPRLLAGHTSSVMSLAWSADGERLLSASHDGSARIWPVADDGSAAEPPRAVVLRGHRDRVRGAAFDRRGERVVTASRDGSARIWNPRSREPRVVSHSGVLRGLDIDRRGARFVTASRRGTVRVWSLADPDQPPLELDVGTPVEQAVFDPRGERLALATDHGRLRIWRPGATPPEIRDGHRGPIHGVAYSPDGRWIVTASADATARLWPAAGGEARVFEHASAVLVAAFDPRGERLATGTADGMVRLWSPDGRELRELSGHQGDVERLTFDPAGRLLASASVDGTARIWDLDGHRKPRILRSQRGVYAIAFNPHGDRLLAGSGDETVRVWDLTREDAAPTVLRHRRSGGVLRAIFDASGERVLSGNDDGSLWVWRLADGDDASPTILRGHGDTVWALALTPDGEHVVSAGGDGTARIWRLAPSMLVELLAAASRICPEPEFRQRYFAEREARARRNHEKCEEYLDLHLDP